VLHAHFAHAGFRFFFCHHFFIIMLEHLSQFRSQAVVGWSLMVCVRVYVGKISKQQLYFTASMVTASRRLPCSGDPPQNHRSPARVQARPMHTVRTSVLFPVDVWDDRVTFNITIRIRQR
jgi:hypothetical protein